VLRAHPEIEHVLEGEAGLSFQAEEHTVGELSLALARAGVGILALTPELATLEDLFFRLTEGAEGNGRAGADADRSSSPTAVELA
jgi:hypothetical protein